MSWLIYMRAAEIHEVLCSGSDGIQLQGGGKVRWVDWVGVLVLCHSTCVLKWMNGIKAQPLLGGCLCDVRSDHITLTPLTERQIKTKKYSFTMGQRCYVIVYTYTDRHICL